MSRLQRWTGQSVGIEHQEAKAMQSVCVVKDFFREGISMDTAMAQVTSFAMSDMYYLPPRHHSAHGHAVRSNCRCTTLSSRRFE